METDKSFLGRGWAFPPEFDGGSGVARMVAGESDIAESLRILMATSPGERVMQPGYGCGLKALVFENISESAVTVVKDTIRRAILFFEPRITLEDIESDASRADEGVLILKLVYTIRATNSRSNLVYPFYFLEGTNIRN